MFIKKAERVDAIATNKFIVTSIDLEVLIKVGSLITNTNTNTN